MSYFFHPAVEVEHLETVAYYESKRPGLGATYLAEFERIMGIVCESPHRNPVERKPDIRCIRMKKFPFSVLYREISGTVQVLAIAHHSRRPQYWLNRL